MIRGSWAAEAAQQLAYKPSLTINRKSNKDIAMNPCRCTVCGEVLDVLTYVHAAKHGYNDKYQMIRKGLVVPI